MKTRWRFGHLDFGHGLTLLLLTVILLLAGAMYPEWDKATRWLLFLILLLSPILLGGAKGVLRIILGAGLLIAFFYVASHQPFPERELRTALPDMLIPMVMLGFEIFLVGLLARRMLFFRTGMLPVFGCVLAYLLIGVAFADAFLLIDEYVAPAFLERGKLFAPRFGDMLYFSFTTLSSCGYGDIVPAIPPSRMLAALEMVTGVMFVALFIGRVVTPITGHSESQNACTSLLPPTEKKNIGHPGDPSRESK